MKRTPSRPGLKAVLPCVLALAWLATAAANPPRSLASDAPSATDGRLRVGDIAPNFTLPTLDGSTVRLADYLGNQPILLVFWSYFCFPCQKELPGMQAVYEELGPDQLSVLSISLDGPAYDEKVRPFLAKNGITFPTMYDNMTTEFFEIAEKYGVVGTPTLFLLDSLGRVRFIHLGRLDADTLKGLVRSAREQAFCAEITKPAAD